MAVPELEATIEAMAPQLLERLHEDFGDSVLFMARVLAARPRATAARVVGLDTTGVDTVVIDGDGEHDQRIEFDAPVTAVSDLTDALFGLVARARRLSGEAGATSAERALHELSSTRTMLTTVARVEDVHPHLRRITFAGGDLATFRPLGPDTFLYVLLPPPGRQSLTIGRDFTWTAFEQMPEAERPAGAYYTLRRWDPVTTELDMLFVLHGDSGDASAWATRAKPGDPVALWGPREAFTPPANTDWYLLVADDTGLPAAASIVESLPEGTHVRVFAEVDCERERQPLPTSSSVDVTWLYRAGAEPGTTTLLPDAVRSMRWPGGAPYVWGGGESRAMTSVRNYVRREIGLVREQVSLVAYWRRTEHGVAQDGD